MSSLATSSPETQTAREGTRALPTWAPEAAFAALLLLGALIVLHETRGLSFYFDDWEFVLHRRGLSSHVLLAPHGPHLVVVPILIYKALLKVFGGTYLPFRLLAALDIVAIGLVLGIVTRRMWGRWWGLAPVLLVVTLGSGAWTLLWSFQVGYTVANAAGLLALLLLARGGQERRSPIVACALLVASLGSGSQGVGYVVGAAVMLLLRGDWRRRAWVVAIPAVLYGLWYLKYGGSASETKLSQWNHVLPYAMTSFASTVSGALGLGSPTNDLPPQLDPSFGIPIAVALIAAVIYALWRGWRPPRLFWGIVVTLVVLWAAAALSNELGTRRPTDTRYIPTSVMLLLAAVCVAVRRPRIRRGATIAIGAGLLAVAATNAGQFTAMRNQMLATSLDSRAELGALLVMRGVVADSFSPAPPFTAGLVNDVQAGVFYSAYDAFGGLPADSVTQLQHDRELPRQLADVALARGEEVGFAFTTAPPATPNGCRAAPTTLTLSSGTVAFIPATQSTLSVSAGRFADGYAVSLGQVPRGRIATVRVPADRAPQVPWRMKVGGRGRVCD